MRLSSGFVECFCGLLYSKAVVLNNINQSLTIHWEIVVRQLVSRRPTYNTAFGEAGQRQARQDVYSLSISEMMTHMFKYSIRSEPDTW